MAPGRLILTALCAGLWSGAASAQFMDMLKNAVGNAATSAVTNAATTATTNAINGVVNGTSKQAAGKGTQEPAAAKPAAAAAPPGCPRVNYKLLPPLGQKPAGFPAVLWPTEPACGTYHFEDYNFEGAKAQVKAFEDAGGGPCAECYGGHSFDYMAHKFIDTNRKRYGKRFTELLATMQPNERVEWEGERYHGTIELTGEEPIGTFPCRQFHWTLLNKTNQIVTEREGLYCMWKYRSDMPVWRKVV
jgi:hypothetical protein